MKRIIFLAILCATFAMPAWAQTSQNIPSADVVLKNDVQLGEPADKTPNIIAYLQSLFSDNNSRLSFIKSVSSDSRIVPFGQNTMEASPSKIKFKIGDLSSFGCLYEINLATTDNEAVSTIYYFQNAKMLTDEWLTNKDFFLCKRDTSTVFEKQTRQFVQMFALGIKTPSSMISRIGYNLADEKNYALFKTIIKHSGFLITKDNEYVKIQGGGTMYNIKIHKSSEFKYSPVKL